MQLINGASELLRIGEQLSRPDVGVADAAVDELVGADTLPGGEGVVGTRVQMDQVHHYVHRPRTFHTYFKPCLQSSFMATVLKHFTGGMSCSQSRNISHICIRKQFTVMVFKVLKHFIDI
jgi:hypothetical protein